MPIEVQELESWLRDRAAEALRIPAEAIDPSRPLIDQGLDSLGAIELGQAVETALGVELPPGVLLEGASLEDLVPLPAQGQQGRQGQQGQQGKKSLESLGSLPSSGGGQVALSHTQRGLWFLHRLHPTSTAYHLSTLTRVLGEATNADLRATFQAMVDRHPALRTIFPLVGDEPVQVIPEQGEVAFEEIDASGWSDAELRSRMEEEAFRPFDLQRGPVFRAALFDRGTERFLVVAMHHIVSDFGALVSLVQEAPPEGTKSFAQFVDWQAEMLAGPEGARLEAFWRARLAGLPELDLPADRMKPANAPEQGGAAWREVGAETLVRLKALARSRGATLYVVLLAAFQAYLHRITGQEDFAVGSPVAGRPAGFGRVFGYFTNPVVLRAEMAGDPPFRELVDRARRRVVEALDHQHFPLPLLVERLRARSELFRTLFVLHRAPAEAAGLVSFSLGEGGGRLRLDGFELESLRLAPRGAQFDVTLAAGERRGALGLQILYDAARFDAATIARWLQHLDNLLAGAAAQPESRLSELPLLSLWERHQVLQEVNAGSDVDLPWSTLHEGFERQAARTPAAVALIDGTRRLTYRDLDARASALAGELRARGAGPEAVVAVKLPRTAELIVALLGTLKAGAAYLPLDPSYPEERIAFMLEDAGAAVVVEEKDLKDLRDTSSFESFLSFKSFQPTPRSLAYLIYTSGSTGRPKGVAIEHAAAVRLIAWAGQAFSPAELRGVLAATSVNFDLSIFEIFVPLSFGGTVILAENALALPELPARDEVTLINTVPSAIAGLLEMGPLPAPVRTVNLAGEPLRRALADQVLAAGVKLWDLYGPSEDTTYSTGAVISTVTAGDPSEPPIGWPLAGSRAFVLDRGFRPLPLGVPGELCLGGGGLARGYLGRAALTAEKFIPSPFGEEPGARLYRTGDLVRRRFDGALEYLGRIDHQVKIRGFRIELGEVEAALLAVPGVREAVVVAREGTLVAYVALTPDQASSTTEEVLREALRERLPAPFVPSFFVFLDALPRTPNGKVDRKALPVPEIPTESVTEAPVGPVEEAVAAVWAGVLGLDRIGRTERFFDLGGHSLLAARVMARLREALGVDLPLTALFDAPTVAGLAARVAAAQAVSGRPLAPVPRDRPLPLSFAQQRLWFLDRLEPGTATYNVPLAVRLEGALSRDLLAGALGEVARRHEAVRTTYEAHGGDPVQIVHPPAPVPVPLIDLAVLPEAARSSEARRLAREEELRPFDLERGPVLRAGLLRLAPEEHVLLLNLHHIACDEWSIRLLFREVVALVAALRDGRPAALPALPVQYADFAVWQREQLAGPALASQLAFWRSRLGDPPVLELPFDRPRPAVQTFRGARLPFTLPAETAAALLALGREPGATAFMTLLAAFQALLARTAGQTDLIVGTPITGRNRVEVENLIGFFLNTLVLRADLSGDPGFAEIVDRTRARVLEAFAHQDLPFETLVDEVGVQRSLGHSPLFQALFVLLHTTPLSGDPAGLRVEPFVTEGATAKFDLTLSIEADGEALTGVIEYNTDLFDRTTALRLAERFRVLCAGAAREPWRPLSELPVLPEAEAHQILREHNDRPPRHDLDVRLHELVAAWAEREPDRIAVEWEGGAWTYAELVGRARALADRLRGLGVGPDVPVGVQASRSPELAVAFLAILEAGGAYLPIDPAYPQERRDFMLEDAGAGVVVEPRTNTDEHGLPRTENAVFHVRARPCSSVPVRAAGSSTLAYLIYTSGSTGTPKGVAVPHRVLTNLILWQIDPDRQGAMPGPWRTLQLASPSFDVSLQEMLSTWCAGGTLVLVSEEDRRDPERLARLLAEREIERIFLPYVALQQLADVLARPESPVPVRLRRVVTAGEQLQVTPQVAEAFRRLSAATGGTALHNQYGPSETHVVTELVLAGDPERWPALPCIGRPIAGVSAHVLDRALQPAPFGVPGELALGGFSPARGYLGRPDQTAGRFIPDPWSDVPVARLYRSGDRARLLPDGRIELLGRIDQQVKIRGYRVEPGEIEAVLAASPQVVEAVVLAVSDGTDRGRRLAAFVVPAPGEEPGPAALRELLLARLPEHMVPSSFTILDQLPLTPSGKVDRRTLAGLQPSAEEAAERIVPRDPVEEMVASAWSEILGIAADRIGARDDFFALGGHSLLATRIVSRLCQAFGVEIRLRDLLERPTVEALAGRIRKSLGDTAAAPVAPVLVSRPRHTEPPLSFAQLRLWLIDRIEPGNATYNVPLAVRLDGELDPGLLARAFGEAARRHEAVRTTFGVRGGDPVQIVHPPAPVPVPVVDLEALPETAREREVLRLAREEEVRPFDLERGPVLRAGLLRLGPAAHVLLLTLHHIACDEWSIRLLFREVVTLLAAWREERTAVLPALPVQYADFAVWQREWLAGPVLESQLAFWRDRLGDPPVLDLPADRPRPPLQTFRGARLSFALPDETSAALFSLSRRRGATPFMTLLAAFQALLARTAGQTDLTVGTPITGRTRIEVENLIGFFLNTLVLRADLSGDPGFGEIVDRTRARALEAYAHQDLPFEKLVDEIGVRRSLGHAPLFQALFVLVHATSPGGGSTAESAGLCVTPLATEGATAKFDLTMAIQADDASLRGVIEYNTDLLDRTTALRLAERFRVLCAAAAHEPHQPLSDLPVLPEAEAHQILREHNDRPPRHDVDVRLHDLVAAWAEKDPERIAVEWQEGSWTYAELVGRARELAARLRALGVGPDVPVGVYAVRGPELAVAFLATLEAGGAYLPIDPAYPRERQDFMLEDAGAGVVVEGKDLKDLRDLKDTKQRDQNRSLSSFGSLSSFRSFQPTSNTVAYVIYTSGSTGTPKGVAVSHRVLTNLILWQIDPERRGAMPEPWRTLQFSAPGFDVSLQEMLSTWCAGGTLVLCSDEDRRDPERLARLLAEAEIERLFLPYVALQQLADRLARPDTPVPSRLRRVITAGEQLQVTPQVVEAFRRLSAATGGTALHNQYGPSETHVVTELILEGDPARWPAVPSIGRPIAGTSAHVLDRALKPVPIGVPGELVLGGFSPARGYLGRPEQTAERFIPDPWSGEPGARLYRSGDLARLLPDGTIELLGRIDHQVKIRGYRIEPGEIEAVLATHPRVRECAVAVREDRPGDRRLIAWVVTDDTEGDAAPAELRDHLRARLPDPMVPAAFVKLGALPLTASGKVLRSALPAPEGERLAAAPYVEPRTTLEREVAAVFREELGLDRVGREDNFFDLGAHSLTMVRAASRLAERLGRPVAVLDLFRTPTVASLARRLGGEEEALPAREILEERAETRRQSLGRRRELRRR